MCVCVCEMVGVNGDTFQSIGYVDTALKSARLVSGLVGITRLSPTLMLPGSTPPPPKKKTSSA